MDTPSEEFFFPFAFDGGSENIEKIAMRESNTAKRLGVRCRIAKFYNHHFLDDSSRVKSLNCFKSIAMLMSNC